MLCALRLGGKFSDEWGRYVGTLHEINSEASTVALENVRTFGTEGRRGGGENEIAPSDEVYDYIVFRGTDVKDLRIEEAPVTKENKPPQIPNDPAIMSSVSAQSSKTYARLWTESRGPIAVM
jgi:hypothetical protein